MTTCATCGTPIVRERTGASEQRWRHVSPIYGPFEPHEAKPKVGFK